MLISSMSKRRLKFLPRLDRRENTGFTDWRENVKCRNFGFGLLLVKILKMKTHYYHQNDTPNKTNPLHLSFFFGMCTY